MNFNELGTSTDILNSTEEVIHVEAFFTICMRRPNYTGQFMLAILILETSTLLKMITNAHISVPLEMRPTEFVWISIDDQYRMSWLSGEQSAIQDLTDDVEMKLYFHQLLMT